MRWVERARCGALRDRDVYILVMVWMTGCLVIAAVHAGKGLAVSVLPDDSLESGPEPYEQYLKVRSRMLTGSTTRSGFECARPSGPSGIPQPVGGGPGTRPLVPVAGYDSFAESVSDDAVEEPSGPASEAVPPF